MKRITQIAVVCSGLLAGSAGLAMAHGPSGFGLFGGPHVDGRIAFLKAELKITEEQETEWKAFEEAIRGSVDRMREVRKSGRDGQAVGQDGKRKAFKPLPAPERLARMEAAATANVDSLRAIRAAFEPLYASMSDEQKKRADRLLRKRGHHHRR